MATPRNIQSLRHEIYMLIMSESPEAADRFLASSPAASDAVSELPLLNRYWRSELARLSINTISERECLIDNISPYDWLRHFTSQVLPTVMRFNLPG